MKRINSNSPHSHFGEELIVECIKCTGELLFNATHFGELVDLTCAMTKVNETLINAEQKELVKKDLEAALEEFIKRETGSSEVSDQAPFVTVNARTKLLAVHSRLLVALQVSIKASVSSLKFKQLQNGTYEKGGFDKASTKCEQKSNDRFQLEEEALKVCKGEMVDCSRFVKDRRLDGKCNNLRDETTTNWGASAIKLRRMTQAAYDEDDLLKHRPRKVEVNN